MFSAADRRLLYASLAEAGLVILAGAIAWWFEVPLWRLAWPTGAIGRALVIGVAATVPMLIFLWLLLSVQWQPLVGLRQQAQSMVSRLLEGASGPPIILLAIMAGVGEELLFRGSLQPLMGRWTSPWGGMLLASLLFGLAHPMSRAYIAVATLCGLYLGTLSLLTGEVLSATVAHALYDIVALVVLYRTAVIANSQA